MPGQSCEDAKCYVVSSAAYHQAKVVSVGVLAIYKVGANGLPYANVPYLLVRTDSPLLRIAYHSASMFWELRYVQSSGDRCR
jgi:hypothetical protein